MPNSGPVYQPTTVSYEQGEWPSPPGFLSQTVGSSGRIRVLQYLGLILGLISIAAGLVLIIEGSVDYSDTKIHEVELGSTPATDIESKNKDVVAIVIGVLLFIVGICFIALYIRIATRRKGCPCLLTKEKRITRQLRDSQGVNGQVMNPSTDLLVTAQYAPVSEIAYQPPGVSEEEETRKLMGSDNKDCSDDSERILDKDPRIVLRPLSKVEESEDSPGSILKESDSVITLNEKRFEPEDSPEPRSLGQYINKEQTIQLEKIILNNSPSTARREISKVVKTNSPWKNSIKRKASVRSKKAPLAGCDEVTPSLRSSWSSLYFNATPTPSDSEIDAGSFSSDSV